ncbi:MAG: hypothetical protein AB7I27_14560 [Bacteriovoracaceae bacterium]
MKYFLSLLIFSGFAQAHSILHDQFGLTIYGDERVLVDTHRWNMTSKKDLTTYETTERIQAFEKGLKRRVDVLKSKDQHVIVNLTIAKENGQKVQVLNIKDVNQGVFSTCDLIEQSNTDGTTGLYPKCQSVSPALCEKASEVLSRTNLAKLEECSKISNDISLLSNSAEAREVKDSVNKSLELIQNMKLGPYTAKGKQQNLLLEAKYKNRADISELVELISLCRNSEFKNLSALYKSKQTVSSKRSEASTTKQ